MKKELSAIEKMMAVKTAMEAFGFDFDQVTVGQAFTMFGSIKQAIETMPVQANWQAERMYSEEDMIATFHYGHQIGMNSILAIQSQHSPQPMPKPDLEVLKKEWFERFIKK